MNHDTHRYIVRKGIDYHPSPRLYLRKKSLRSLVHCFPIRFCSSSRFFFITSTACAQFKSFFFHFAFPVSPFCISGAILALLFGNNFPLPSPSALCLSATAMRQRQQMQKTLKQLKKWESRAKKRKQKESP